jgi:hypothetical protein
MISIYLDDNRTPIEHPNGGEWTIVRNCEDFIATVSKIGLAGIDIISFDHDLDWSATVHFFDYTRETYEVDYTMIKERTGMDAVKWMVREAKSKSMDLPQCYVHSANPIGSGNMIGYINMYLKEIRKPQTCIRANWKHNK